MCDLLWGSPLPASNSQPYIISLLWVIVHILCLMHHITLASDWLREGHM